MDMVLRRIRRKKKVSEIIKSFHPSPYLVMISQKIISMQNENGSWFNNPLLTALALNALHEASKTTDLDFEDSLRAGIRYLKRVLKDLSKRILASDSLYSQLDTNSITFSLLINTLETLNHAEIDEDTLLAFQKLESEVTKYCSSLESVEVVSHMLKCHLIKSIGEPPEELVKFILNKCLQLSESEYLLLMGLEIIFLLDEKYNELLKNVWKKVSKRYGLENKSHTEHFHEIALKALEQLNENTNIEALFYGILLAKKVSERYVPRIGELILKKTEEAIDNIYKGNEEVVLHELSLVAMALSLSPFGNTIFVHSDQLNEVFNAIEWYEKNKKENTVILTSKSYKFIMGYLGLSTLIIVFLAFLLLTNDLWLSITTVLVALIVGLIANILYGQLLNKP